MGKETITNMDSFLWIRRLHISHLYLLFSLFKSCFSQFFLAFVFSSHFFSHNFSKVTCVHPNCVLPKIQTYLCLEGNHQVDLLTRDFIELPRKGLTPRREKWGPTALANDNSPKSEKSDVETLGQSKK